MQTYKVTNNTKEVKEVRAFSGVKVLINPGRSVSFVIDREVEKNYYKNLQDNLDRENTKIAEDKPNNISEATESDPIETEEAGDTKETENTGNESELSESTEEATEVTEVTSEEVAPKKRSRRKKVEE